VIADNPIIQTFGPVSDLARRLREGHAKVKQLELELSAARSKLEAANARAIAIDRKIQEMQQQPKLDDPKEMRENELRIEQLTQQLRSNQSISSRFEKDEAYMLASLENQRQQLSDAEAERDTVMRLLKSQWDTARKQLDMQLALTEATRQGFDAGEINGVDKLKAEQALAETEAKAEQLELLLNMYQSLGSEPESPQPEPAANTSQEDSDAAP
jgi:chromosome segregation ATPase